MRRVAVGESNSIIGNRIYVWRGNILTTIDPDVGITQIVSQKDDDIGFICRKARRAQRAQQ